MRNNQKQKWISSAILGLFFLLVAATAYLSELMKNPIKNHNEFIEQALVFNNKELEDITRLSLKNKTGEYVFQKYVTENNSSWKMVSPVRYSTNSVFIEKLFTSLVKIKTKKLLLDDQANNSNFSLDKPTSTLTLSNDVQKTIAINIGIMNTIDNSTYVKISERAGIYHIEAPSISLENLTIADLVESNVFDIKIDEISSLSIFKKNVSAPQFEIKKIENKWFDSTEKEVPNSQVENTLNDFLMLKSTHIMEKSTDAQKKQTLKLISPPLYTLKITDSNNEVATFSISDITESLIDIPLNNEPHYIVIDGRKQVVFVMKKDSLQLFDIKNQ